MYKKCRSLEIFCPLQYTLFYIIVFYETISVNFSTCLYHENIKKKWPVYNIFELMTQTRLHFTKNVHVRIHVCNIPN